jgi:integrase
MAKRRASGEGSITWDADAERWVGRLPRDERGRRAKVKGRTEAEVRRKLNERLREREQGLTTTAGNMTVRQFLEAWIRDTIEPGDLAGKTKQSYELTVRKHLVPGLGRVRLARLTPMHVQRFINDALEAGKGRRTVQASHAVLRIALGQAVLWGLIPRNVAKLVRGPRYQPTERRPFTRAEQIAILDAAEGERLGVAIFLVHATGMRLSELLGQRWADVDLDNGLLRLRHQLDPLGPELKDVKTTSGRRWLPLPPIIVAMLREHRARQDKQRDDAGEWEDNDLIFTTRNGRPISQRNMQRTWRRVTERAGVEHRGIHHLRHTYGTTLAEHGVHERVAQQLLGHADSRTTREIYTHVSEKMMGEAAQAITDAVADVIGHRAAGNGSPAGSLDHDLADESRDDEDAAGR